MHPGSKKDAVYLYRALIAFCQQHGIRFALDHFGTGMASFDFLKRLPFDVIKIDGAFVRLLLNDAMDQAVVDSSPAPPRGKASTPWPSLSKTPTLPPIWPH